jgi:TonB-dependent starch-binding outer membrane protein SusC
MECMMKQQRFIQKTLFTLLLLLGGIASAWAQNRTVSGVVKDAKGDPLPTVTVLEKGTKNGIVTDFDGKFSLKVTDNAPTTLVFTFIGFTTQEVAIGAQNVVSITL